MFCGTTFLKESCEGDGNGAVHAKHQLINAQIQQMNKTNVVSFREESIGYYFFECFGPETKFDPKLFNFKNNRSKYFDEMKKKHLNLVTILLRTEQKKISKQRTFA